MEAKKVMDTSKIGRSSGSKLTQFKPGQRAASKKEIEAKELELLEKLANQVNKIEGEKIDVSGRDPANVCRAIGLSEFAVLRGVKKLADRSKSDVVRLRALELACKVLRMIREDSQQPGGITVVIQALEGPQQINIQAPAPTLPDPYHHPEPANPDEPIVITK